jgi:hypothetical protein
MLEGINHQSFESIIGESVELGFGEISFLAKVESVSLLQSSEKADRQPFSVVLQSQDSENHGQQTYQLSHPALGNLSLFMVPIGMNETGIRYEIIFN